MYFILTVRSIHPNGLQAHRSEWHVSVDVPQSGGIAARHECNQPRQNRGPAKRKPASTAASTQRVHTGQCTTKVNVPIRYYRNTKKKFSIYDFSKSSGFAFFRGTERYI